MILFWLMIGGAMRLHHCYFWMGRPVLGAQGTLCPSCPLLAEPGLCLGLYILLRYSLLGSRVMATVSFPSRCDHCVTSPSATEQACALSPGLCWWFPSNSKLHLCIKACGGHEVFLNPAYPVTQTKAVWSSLPKFLESSVHLLLSSITWCFGWHCASWAPSGPSPPMHKLQREWQNCLGIIIFFILGTVVYNIASFYLVCLFVCLFLGSHLTEGVTPNSELRNHSWQNSGPDEMLGIKPGLAAQARQVKHFKHRTITLAPALYC